MRLRHVLLVLMAATAMPAAADPLPSFSWDHVPCYMHVRKNTAFTEDEIRYLASFPLVTLEKTTGAKDYGSTEKGTLAAARAIKAINPATKVLYYRNVIVHYGSYDANETLTGMPGAFLVDAAGNDKLVRKQTPAYDLTNPAVRNWWVANARQVCADPAIDGVFLDGNVKVLTAGYLEREIGREKKAAVVDGYDAMVRDLRQALGPEKLMVANLLRAALPAGGIGHLSPFDGSYIEGFEKPVAKVSEKDYVAKGMAAFQQAARNGGLIAFTVGLGAEEDDDGRNPAGTDEMRKPLAGTAAATERFEYLLAIFLICAEKHSYFLAHDGYDARKSTVWMTRPPELERPLGAPTGPATRSGDVYTREFAHARVRLDLERRRGEIEWTAP